jgi:hypothetical protein
MDFRKIFHSQEQLLIANAEIQKSWSGTFGVERKQYKVYNRQTGIEHIYQQLECFL